MYNVQLYIQFVQYLLFIIFQIYFILAINKDNFVKQTKNYYKYLHIIKLPRSYISKANCIRRGNVQR